MNNLTLLTFFSLALVLLFFLYPKVSHVQYQFVELKTIIPNLVIDMRYATENNFTGQKVYPTAHCALVKDAAYALQSAAKDLHALGYRFKIWDAYRPLHVQYIFWKIMPDDRYVADPKKGSRHNRGCAVDLTLVDKDGIELDMGTGFDDFSERAHHDYTNLSPEVLNNRKLLKSIMEKNGFTSIQTEWWHFDYKDWKKYPILDVPLEDI
jgi:D-alanyl-D-alanine dipeptidase